MFTLLPFQPFNFTGHRPHNARYLLARVYAGMREEMVDFMVDKIREFVKDKGKREG